ncbi:hypothetical protein VaNZ11_011830 [Volvox africanus]|uniref:RING-type domain-containing protein n=1 Tax=Volvox africanus TaxID=51714 RepID=A0ABQ5SDZ8_9CHLO|nr:hypothetical protein VaNZ11_011830 [Volvox africanus]
MDEFQYAQEVPADLLCSVCYHPLCDPRCCPRCQKAFCSGCITTWASTQKRKDLPLSCPYCRAKLRLSQLFRAEALSVRLGDLHVLCPYDCSGTIRRADLANHLACLCPRLPVPCPDCGVSVFRGELAAHVGAPSCHNRRLACPNQPLGCQAQFQLLDMQYHAMQCPYEPLECRHCHATVLRGQAEDHCWVACPALCPCPNRCFGCAYVAPSLEHLADHVVRNCQYAESSTYMARMCGALGTGDPMYGGGGRFRSKLSSGGHSHLPTPHPQFPHLDERRSSHETHRSSTAGRLCGMRESAPGSAAAGGVWCDGLFVPASLYPNGLLEPQSRLLPPGGPASGNGGGGESSSGSAKAPAPWPWATDSTGEVSDAATVALTKHFVPAPNADQLRQNLQLRRQEQHQQQIWEAKAASVVVPERYRRLLRLVRGEEEISEEDPRQGEHQPQMDVDVSGQDRGLESAGEAVTGGDLIMQDAVGGSGSGSGSGSVGSGARGPALKLELELPPPEAFWWHPVATADGPTHGSETPPLSKTAVGGHEDLDPASTSAPVFHIVESVDTSAHADHLTLSSATVYGTLIDLMARLYERGGVDGSGGGGTTAVLYGIDNEIPRPEAGRRDFQLLQLYEGNDNNIIDLPSCDTALHHGHRAFWALGLLRLTRRLWPSASLHWRSLAALNDLVTALARNLLGRVVEVISCELVQESSPMGEGDIILAVQNLFPSPLTAEALESIRQVLQMYDDIFFESEIWLEGWSTLRVKLELGLDLGRVACLVGQYTPLHGHFVAGEDDPESEEGEEARDDDSDDSDDSDSDDSDDDDDDDDDDDGDDGDMEEDEESSEEEWASDSTNDNDSDNGDIEEVPRRRTLATNDRRSRPRRSDGSSSNGDGSLPPLEHPDPEGPRGHRAGGSTAAASSRNAGGSVNNGGIRAPVMGLLNNARLRFQSLRLDLRAFGRGGRGGGRGRPNAWGSDDSDSSSDEWESMSEEEAVELLQQQQQQQEERQDGQQQSTSHPPGGDAAGREGRPATIRPPDRIYGISGGGGRGEGRGGGGGGSASVDSPSEMDVASSGSSDSSDSSESRADIRGVVALTAVLDWFVMKLVEKTRSYVESGLMQLGEGNQVQPWHLQLVLDTSLLGQLLLLPRERMAAGNGVSTGVSRFKESGFCDGPSLGSQIIGALPLRPLARMLASLALQPVSALLVLATTGAAATATGPAPTPITEGNGGSGSDVAQPTPILSPLDMRCYCGGPARAAVASGPPCSYWSGHQCEGCAAASAGVRQLPFDERLKIVGGVLWGAFRGASGKGEEEVTTGEQALPGSEGPSPALPCVLHPPPDLVAALTGGRLRGELLQRLLPPALRPLLQPEAFSYAARLANLGLTSGLVRIHQLDTPCWWRQPGGTAYLAASAAVEPQGQNTTSVLAAAISTELAAAVRPDPAWLHQLQPHLGMIRDVEAAAALCRDVSAVLYGMPTQHVDRITVQLNASDGVDGAFGKEADAASLTDKSSSSGHHLLATTVADAGSAAAGGKEDNTRPDINHAEATNQSQMVGVSGCSPDRTSGSLVRGSPSLHELPICIPRDVFMAMFHESWEVVCAEHGDGGASAAVAHGAPLSGAPEPSARVHAQQPRGHPGGAGQHRRKRGRPVFPPAMGAVSNSAVRRHFRPLQTADGESPVPIARVARPSDGPGPSAPVTTASVFGPTELGRGPGQGSLPDEAKGGVGEEMEWSPDALELLHKAAEAALAEAIQEDGEGGISGRGGYEATAGKSKIAGGGILGNRW